MFLYIVRHGQSNGNTGTDKTMDPYLSPTGLRQAELLGEYLASTKFDCILSSTLTRAIQTASAVASRQENAPIEIMADLVESGTPPGCCERTREELLAVYPNLVFTENSVAAPDSWSPDHTEYDFYLRGERVISYLKDRFDITSDRRVLVVAHAGFNHKMLAAAMGWGHLNDVIFSQRNTCVNLLHFFLDSDGRYKTRLTYSNDITHLLGNDCPIT